MQAMKSRSLTAAHASLAELVDEVLVAEAPIAIVDNGRRVAVLIGADAYDALTETLAVLADQNLMERHRRGLEEIARGDVVHLNDLESLTRELGGSDDHHC
jgi:prevent-host-death family protein